MSSFSPVASFRLSLLWAWSGFDDCSLGRFESDFLNIVEPASHKGLW